MSMSKKDFWAMANALSYARPTKPESPTTTEYNEWVAKLDVWSRCVSEIARACAEQYAGSYGFDHDLFTEACNGEG